MKRTEFSTRFGHIKEFERTLFKEITALRIPAEKKRFVRFQEDDKKKGIIVNDAEGIEELIECDFVFDCTGSQRVLVNTINKLVTPAPFTIKPIHDNVTIRQNLLAYVQMTEADLNKVSSVYAMNRTAYFLTAEQQVNAVNRMRALGWKDFSLPQLYGAYFGKDKCCLYMECPDNLPTANYELWVKIALDVC